MMKVKKENIKENNITSKSKFKLILKKFEDISRETTSIRSSKTLRSLIKQERGSMEGKLTPSVVKVSRKPVENGVFRRTFNDHKLDSIDIESDGQKENSIRKRKFTKCNIFNEGQAPCSRKKIKL